MRKRSSSTSRSSSSSSSTRKKRGGTRRRVWRWSRGRIGTVYQTASEVRWPAKAVENKNDEREAEGERSSHWGK